MDFITSLLAAPFICIGWIIVGAVAGTIADRFTGGDNKSLIVNIILGLVGAVVGGMLVGLLNIARPEGGLTGVVVSLIVATVGAIVLIGISRILRGQPIRR